MRRKKEKRGEYVEIARAKKEKPMAIPFHLGFIALNKLTGP